MKPFKILRQIFQILSIALFLTSFVMCAIELESNAEFFTMVLSFVGLSTLATVGTFLLSATNDTAKRVGHGFVISSFVLGLTVAIMFIEASSAAILMLVSVILLALYYLCVLIVSIMQRSSKNIESPEDDIRIVHVKEWKKIMDEGIITKEEYEVKRCQILGIKHEPEEKKEEPKGENDLVA